MPKNMVRKQLYIEPEQDKLLKRLARERGVTEAELVRKALDKFISDPEQHRQETWAREVAFLRAHQEATKDAPQGPRDWTRESIYEERMQRYDRHSGR